MNLFFGMAFALLSYIMYGMITDAIIEVLKSLLEKARKDADAITAAKEELQAQLAELQIKLSKKIKEEKRALQFEHDIEQLLEKYGVTDEEQATQITFYKLLPDGSKKEIIMAMLKVSQKLPLSVSFKDKFGNDAKVDGKPEWALTDPALGSLSVSEDGMSAELQPAGQMGSCKVQVSADADLGEGVKTILGELDIDLLPGDAEVVQIAAGEAV